MRKGPHPLPLHLNLLSLASLETQEYSSRVAEPITRSQATELVRGIKLYQQHTYKVERPEKKSIWTFDTVKILQCNKTVMMDSLSKPILLIPSIVNRSYIFDLCEERSFAQWLCNQGYRVYLLDWGELTQSQEEINMEKVILERLLPAIKFLAQELNSKISILAYCMGGTLTLAAATRVENCISRMTLMATPWDFGRSNASLMQRLSLWSPSVLPVIETRGFLPASWTQALFASMDTQGSLKKFSKFANTEQNSLEAKLFVAVEDWLNDGVDLPGKLAENCLRSWFLENQPMQNKWKLGDNIVDITKLNIPILAIMAKRDKLVSVGSCLGITKNQNIKLLEPDCGHIGLIAGSHAIKDVWDPIGLWLSKDLNEVER